MHLDVIIQITPSGSRGRTIGGIKGQTRDGARVHPRGGAKRSYQMSLVVI